jgi:hypothetical protein
MSFFVKSTVNLDFAKIKQLGETTVTALEQTADALLTEVKNAEVMPFDTGNLQNESTFVDDSHSREGSVSIVSTTPYARRLYYHPEFNFSKEEHRAAMGEWFRPWLKGGVRSDFAGKTFKVLYKRLNKI